jgi:hypothetical protein
MGFSQALRHKQVLLMTWKSGSITEAVLLLDDSVTEEILIIMVRLQPPEMDKVFSFIHGLRQYLLIESMIKVMCWILLWLRMYLSARSFISEVS